ncbi:uncharacterized protein BDV17DRAFT_260644 [Aspergillus undulatus]|uniref:uncharacterized protein n=1 Tax=Aspergillus undulatus TaxID=1810928 RepID=UPI003CCD445A
MLILTLGVRFTFYTVRPNRPCADLHLLPIRWTLPVGTILLAVEVFALPVLNPDFWSVDGVALDVTPKTSTTIALVDTEIALHVRESAYVPFDVDGYRTGVLVCWVAGSYWASGFGDDEKTEELEDGLKEEHSKENNEIDDKEQSRCDAEV